MPNSMNGAFVLKLLSFADHLSQFSVSPRAQRNGQLDGAHPGQAQSKRQANDLAYWHSFVERFFSPKGVLRQSLWSEEAKEHKVYEISTAALARYYWTHYKSGIQNIQMIMENANEKNLPSGGHFVESVKTTFIYYFGNGHQVGHLLIVAK